MQKLCALAFILFTSFTVSAQQKHAGMEAAIEGMFEGLSLVNTDTLKHYATADFTLLEEGEVWNMDTLLSKIEPLRQQNVKRVNSFEYLNAEENGKLGWISYFNTAKFTQGERSQEVRWLESAVLVKEGNRWRIKMLHSTRIRK